MKYINKLPLMAFALGLGYIGIASSFTPSKKVAGSYRLITGSQSWNGPVDQDVDKYTLIGSSSYTCSDTQSICTYDIVDDVVTQNSRGTFTPQ